MIKPHELSPVKLGLISFGSLTGMGIGLLLSFLITSTIWRLIVITVLLFVGISSIFNNIEFLKD